MSVLLKKRIRLEILQVRKQLQPQYQHLLVALRSKSRLLLPVVAIECRLLYRKLLKIQMLLKLLIHSHLKFKMKL